jgi:hypothetical protein
MDRLISQKDWSKILRLKKLLREYFEYSGNYDKGVSFGEVYVHALKQLKTLDEEAWSRIKDIGYMHILAGRHKKGREEIEEALRLVEKLDNHGENKATLLFYAYRYLSISYHRDNILKDIKKSSYYLDLARKQLPHMKKS